MPLEFNDLVLVFAGKPGHVSVSMSCGPAVTSCRRWYGNCLGLIGVTGFNQVALIAYHWFHVEPRTIHRWYYNLSNIARL